ncbi:hypothetical protein F4604DRAFT_1308443 [Suillus subluteus]|nr:hypothetical protein F4604DRAFT_1308443 [Suillus subluteus]
MILIYFQSQTLRNVVIIGHSQVGKSSLVNMLCPSARAPVSNDTIGCTQVEQAYTCNLGEQQSCTVHDTIGLEEGRWGFLCGPKAEKRLKSYLKKMEVQLVVYCMPGAGLRKSHGRNFKKFKALLTKVPVVVVVTSLENFGGPLETWWSNNKVILGKLGIPASAGHACVTTLPKAELEMLGERYLYDSSCMAVKALIRNNLFR